MRLYFDLDESDPIMDELCLLACSDPKLDLCKVSKLPGNPMTNASEVFPRNWRFFPSVDPQVKVCLPASALFLGCNQPFSMPWYSNEPPDLLKIRDILNYFYVSIAI